MKGLRCNTRVPFVPACRLTGSPTNWLTSGTLDTMPNWIAFAIAVYNPRYVTPEKAMAMYLRPELGQNARWLTSGIAEEIIFFYYVRHWTHEAIASLYGVSCSTVRKILRNGQGSYHEKMELI